jgi:pimeloyl-ACP methyl ester carboxylesterase
MNRVFTILPLTLLAEVLLVGNDACTHSSSSWHDPSPHQVQLVTVQDNVKLEVLDWGGSGRPIVLLAGSGNTAHVYDDFAPKLSGPYHVYGITRRGFGASTHPDFGYTDQRLADDVLQVLHFLKIVNPVLVGHSMAGAELTTLGSQHSDELSGLVYLDALLDHGAHDAEYAAIRKKLPAAMLGGPQPSDADVHSFQAYRDWQKRTSNTVFPESELRNCYQANPDGSMGDYKTAESVFNAMDAGVRKRDYSRIRVPVLAFVTLPASAGNLMGGSYTPKNEQERAAMDESFKQVVGFIKQDEKKLQTEVPGARVIEMPGADHHIFLSNESDVLRELRRFLEGLPRP